MGLPEAEAETGLSRELFFSKGCSREKRNGGRRTGPEQTATGELQGGFWEARNSLNNSLKYYLINNMSRDFSRGSVVKDPPAIVGDMGSVPGLGTDLLEEGMATHPCILAQEIPGTEEPSRLQSMGLQRVGTQLSD